MPTAKVACPDLSTCGLSDCIIAVARAKDRAAFTTLFAHYAPRLNSYFRRLGATDSVAEELAQETLLLVWRKADSFDPQKAGASSWVFTIARNLRIDKLRHDGRAQAWEREPPPASGLEAVDDALVLVQREPRLGQALAALPMEEARLVVLSYFEGKSHNEIQRELKLPLGTIKSRLRRALAQLRKEFGREPRAMHGHQTPSK